MPVDLSLEQPCPRALSGAPVTARPSAKIPSREPLRGKYVEPVAQDASRHAADMYAAGHESEQARIPSRRGDGIEQEQT
jgi:hypothetical protein